MSTKNKRKKPQKEVVAVSKETTKTSDNVENSSSNEESPLQKFERELAWCIEQLQLGLETQSPDSRQAMEASKVLKILVSAKAPMIKKRQVMRNTFGDYRKKMQEQDRKSAAAAKKMKILPVEDKGYQKSQFFRKSLKRVAGDSVSQQSATSGNLPFSGDSVEQTSGALPSSGDSVNVVTAPEGKNRSIEKQEQIILPKATNPDELEKDLQTSFKFNFKLNDDDNNLESGDNNSACSNNLAGSSSDNLTQNGSDYSFTLNPSDNTFRFNFSVTDELT